MDKNKDNLIKLNPDKLLVYVLVKPEILAYVKNVIGFEQIPELFETTVRDMMTEDL